MYYLRRKGDTDLTIYKEKTTGRLCVGWFWGENGHLFGMDVYKTADFEAMDNLAKEIFEKSGKKFDIYDPSGKVKSVVA